MTEHFNQLSNYSTYLFDMDGTLVNTEFLHARAASDVMKKLGIEVDLESSINQFYGMADTEVLKLLMPDISPNEITSIIAEKNKHLIEILLNLKSHEKEEYITPGLFDFFDFLLAHNKTIAVVSASEDVIVKETLACFGIDKYASLQMGRNQTERTKPHPDPYLEACKRLNASTSETLIFEDSPTGMQAALATKSDVIRITHFAHCSAPLNLLGNYREIKNFRNFF